MIGVIIMAVIFVTAVSLEAAKMYLSWSARKPQEAPAKAAAIPLVVDRFTVGPEDRIDGGSQELVLLASAPAPVPDAAAAPDWSAYDRPAWLRVF